MNGFTKKERDYLVAVDKYLESVEKRLIAVEKELKSFRWLVQYQTSRKGSWISWTWKPGAKGVRRKR